MINIRKAIKEDCEAILNLVTELAIFEKCPNEVSITLEDFTDAGFGKNPVWWAFVAEVENKIIGFALYYIRFSTWKGNRMYLEDLYVKEDYRKQQVGKLLFDQLIIEAKEKKFDAICWQVLDWNTPAINFYKKINATITNEWLNGTLIIT